MTDFQNFLEQKDQPQNLSSRIRQSFKHENTLRMVNNKRAKVVEFYRLQKSRNDLYWKLSGKLEQQLKEIKSHNTPEAREKLFLLEKCRNQKHIRRKTRQIPAQFKENNYIPASPSLNRPQSCCPKMLKHYFSETPKPKPGHSPSHSHSQPLALTQTKNSFFKQSSRLQTLQSKFQKIQRECARQYSKSQEIKDDIETVHFYQKLITKNSSIIFTKIL